MRRISWIDQRINGGVAHALRFGVWFFWGGRMSAMADRRHHGEGEHHQGDVTMPTMPGPALVVIRSPNLFFAVSKLILHRPPMAFNRDQRFDRRSRRRPCGEEGEIAIGDVTGISRPLFHRP